MDMGEPKRSRGGRPKGSRNKKTVENIAAAKRSGLTPLEYLLSVMKDEKLAAAARIDAAKAAAPYIHPKLTQIEHSGGKKPIEISTIWKGV